MENKIYYLAYGSNLNVEQMSRRCPNAIKVGSITLNDYELEFRIHLTIKPSKGKVVPIGVWQLDKDDEASLDIYEGYPYLYRKEYFDIILEGKVINALIYIMNDVRVIQLPSNEYMNTCLQGYKDFDFDSKYLNKAYELAKKGE